MGIKTSFNWKDLEKEILKSVTKNLEMHPEEVLKHHVGETYDAECPHCGRVKVTILSGGKVRCNSCHEISHASVDVKLR